jgi:hypothetical protein
MSRSLSKQQSFRPSLEGLEARSLMACQVFAAGGVLNIIGDARPDTVVVRDHGNGFVDGSATGKGVFAYAGIKTIVIDAGAGNDQVSYNLDRPLLPNVTRMVNVALRDGTDSFFASLHGPRGGGALLPGSLLLMNVTGDRGDDRLVLDANGVTMDHATMKIAFHGGDGNDVLGMAYSGHVDHGGVSLFAFGDRGDDTIGLWMAADAPSVAPAPGGFRGIIDGGLNNDTLLFHLDAPPAVGTAPTSIDGGAGNDLAITDIDTAHVNNVETVWWL